MQDKIWEWPGDEARPVLLSVIPNVLHSDQVLHVRTTVKRELLFQQAICYLSFKWVNILHAWTENSVNGLVKNSKHITPIASPPKPDLTHLHHKQLVKNAKITLQIPDYLLVM